MDEEFSVKINEKFNENKLLFWKEVKKERGGVGAVNVRIKGERGWNARKR